MTRQASRSEATRLGRPGSYRLGRLGRQGLPQPALPRPCRPSFTRQRRRGPAPAWILAGLAGTALVGGGVALGLWFSPFAIAVVAGLAVRWGRWRSRVAVPVVLIMSVAGWGLALWLPALRAAHYGAAARAVAALGVLPPSVAGSTAAMLAVSAAQGLAGLWLGRTVAPRLLRG